MSKANTRLSVTRNGILITGIVKFIRYMYHLQEIYIKHFICNFQHVIAKKPKKAWNTAETYQSLILVRFVKGGTGKVLGHTSTTPF